MAAMLTLTVMAANKFDYVYLNNGNVVKGVVESNDDSKVTIRDTNGNLLSYNKIEVNRVVLGKDPVVPSAPAGSTATGYRDFSQINTGFWWGADLSGGISLREHVRNISFVELDAVAGYRFNEFIRIGAGIGIRDYLGRQDEIRARHSHISYPIFATARGNIIVNDYRNVVPYWSVDCGAAIQDGFMFRPTIGIRIGTEKRHSFILGLSYLNQRLLVGRYVEDNATKDKFKNISFLSLRLGYEF